jgi:MFS transporter, ACS family, solute carrier family 17 (sodium-dependent inorganic phosphate cotransporter), member 5
MMMNLDCMLILYNFQLSHIDLSPNFASTLMGITNASGAIFSLMAPLSVSVVVKDEVC